MKTRDALLTVAMLVLIAAAHSEDPCKKKRCSRREMCVSIVSPCKTPPCDRVAKCLPSRTPTLCTKLTCQPCPKGFLHQPDPNGCQTCKCYQPCAGVSTSPQQQCVASLETGGSHVYYLDKKECYAWGDPHVVTYDQIQHDYMEAGLVILSQRSVLCPDLHDFRVLVFQEKGATDNSVSYVTSMELQLEFPDGAMTTVKIGQDIQIWVNGNIFVPGNAMPRGIKSINVVDGLVETDIDVSARFDGKHKVWVWIPLSYNGCVEGMCGNADGNGANDWINKYGTNCFKLPSYKKFWCVGNSWLVNHHGPLQTEDNVQRVCSARIHRRVNRKNKFCAAITSKRGPFRKCLRKKRKEAELIYASCNFDACASKGDFKLAKTLACESVSTFAEVCGNLVSSNWRKTSGCLCPGELVWATCGSNCTRTCRKPGVNCGIACVAKCQCPRTRPFQQGNNCLDIATCKRMSLWKRSA